jgi:DnaK suppressor protein
MDEAVARQLLDTERTRVEALIAETQADSEANRSVADEPGYWSDAAQPITAEKTDDDVRSRLRNRLAAIIRAEQRLQAGTYGRSIRSGQPIPDERLEADPAAELTVAEAAADRG